MTEMNLAEFHAAALHGAQPILITYSAPWCVYCRHLLPPLDRLSHRYSRQVAFGIIDIDREPELAQREQIEVVPTLVLYQAGKDLGSIVVPESSAQVDAFLRETLGL